MRYTTKFDYRMGIGFLVFWSLFTLFEVWSIWNGAVQGDESFWMLFRVILLIWGVYNVIQFSLEISDYRKRVGNRNG